MSDARQNPNEEQGATRSSFDEMLPGTSSESAPSFSVGFRGYDRDEVDKTIADLTGQLKAMQLELDSVQSSERTTTAQLQAELEQLKDKFKTTEDLQDELQAKTAQLAEAEEQIKALSEQLVEGDGEDDQLSTRTKFEAVLRVAEEQANVLLQNAAVQAERLLDAARQEVASQKAQAEADVARITEQAQHDADQIRLKIETEYTAHEAMIQRESAHAKEKVAQAVLSLAKPVWT